jgi:hypothetical protein
VDVKILADSGICNFVIAGRRRRLLACVKESEKSLID